MAVAETLVRELTLARDRTWRLIADFAGDEWTFQPGPGMAHVLWVCGHLAVMQHDLVHLRCFGVGVLEDAYVAHFRDSASIPSATVHAYPAVETVLNTMDATHVTTCERVRAMTDDGLAQPAYAADGHTPHPHYRDRRGAVAHCIHREVIHAGLIAQVRRALGKAQLRELHRQPIQPPATGAAPHMDHDV
ncbi:MAG: DinB family protein [Phycisphaerae bacterium]